VSVYAIETIILEHPEEGFRPSRIERGEYAMGMELERLKNGSDSNWMISLKAALDACARTRNGLRSSGKGQSP